MNIFDRDRIIDLTDRVFAFVAVLGVGILAATAAARYMLPDDEEVADE